MPITTKVSHLMSHLSYPERLLLFLRVTSIALILGILITFLATHTHAQSNRMGVTDALQNQRIDDLAKAQSAANDAAEDQRNRIEGLEEKVASIQGIGTGLACALGVLQGLQTVLQLKKKP